MVKKKEKEPSKEATPHEPEERDDDIASDSKELQEEYWPSPSGWGVQAWASRRAKDAVPQTVCGQELFIQQQFCRDFLQYEGPFRGLLMFHGLGSGKSCSAIATSEALRQQSQGKLKKVFVLLPAALHNNYVREVRRCGGQAFCEERLWSKAPGEKGWTAVDDGDKNGTPFNELDASAQLEIREQIDLLTHETHEFIHYNGLNSTSIRRFTSTASNPFDDSVVVVDEVHNMISNLSSGKLVKHVYDRIFQARNCRVVLLSGTPLVNEPEEVALLINLVHGPVDVHSAKVPLAGLPDEKQDSLNDCLVVLDSWEHTLEDGTSRAAMVRLAPPGFQRAEQEGHGMLVRTGISKEAQMQLLEKASGIPPRQWDRQHLQLLPPDPDRFKEAFVDDSVEGMDPALRNEDVLLARMGGCISFFKGHPDELYPKVRRQEVVRLPLSAHQFTVYANQRASEYRLERAAARRRNNNSTGAAVRPGSRSACTFAFPPEVKRPRVAELVEGDDYSAELDKAIQELRNLPATTFAQSPEPGVGLAKLSPKFDHIITALKESPGTAIIYSQFRRAEGVSILAVALEANGYAELAFEGDAEPQLRIGGKPVTEKEAAGRKRYASYIGNADPDGSQRLLATFNNQVQAQPNLHGETLSVMLITASGAEGISTSNVRQVHIMEPFWHANRTEQVIGRARRAYSHKSLPPEERTLDVFLYLATLADEQRGAVPPSDEGLTSDEHVFNVSERKRKVVLLLLDIMQRAAVDCRAPWSEVKDGQCAEESMKPAASHLASKPRYRPGPIHSDASALESEGRNLKVLRNKTDGRLYYADLQNKKLYDYDAWRQFRSLKLVGSL